MRYTIETTDQFGSWYIAGSERYEHDARYHMGRYKRMYPNKPFRVVNHYVLPGADLAEREIIATA